MKPKKQVELKTASECLINSGLNYQVEKVRIQTEGGMHISMDDYRAIRRADTKEVFNIARKSYEVVQNTEAFSFFDEIVGTGQAKYDKAFAYRGGAVVVLRAVVPHSFDVLPGDEVATYLQLVNSHDGSKALSIVPLVVRLVCTNGLTALREQATKRVAVKHTQNGKSRFVFDAKTVMAEEREYFRLFSEKCKAMAKKQMSSLAIDSFLEELFMSDSESEDVPTRTKNRMADVKALVDGGIGMDIKGVRGTAWGTYNAVTEYIDHTRPTKGESENREFASLFGSGSRLRERAFALLTR